MTSVNSFDLLGNDESDDPSLLFEKQKQKKIEEAKNALAIAIATSSQSPSVHANLKAIPVPPTQPVRDTWNYPASHRGRGGNGGYTRRWQTRGRGGARGGGFVQNGNPRRENGSSSVAGESFDKERRPFTRPRQNFNHNGLRRGGYATNVNGHAREVSGPVPMRNFNRISYTRRGNSPEKEGSVEENFLPANDDVIVSKVFAEEEEPLKNEDKNVGFEKKQDQNHHTASKATPTVQATLREDKRPEDKEMTLEEYEKVREEKRKGLLAMKSEERKVELDKELKSMLQLSNNRRGDDVFIKLGGADKDSRKPKDNAEREERSKKCINIDLFINPDEWQRRHYAPGGRARGRGRGERAQLKNGGDVVVADADRSFTLKDIMLDEVQFPVLAGVMRV